MKDNLFITHKLSTGSMFRMLNSRELLGEIEFFSMFSFPSEYNSKLLTLRAQVN